jgi:non-heme chloroperoxidase
MTPACWEEWIKFFATKGYTAIAPGWPGIDDQTVEDVTAHPEALKGLSIHIVVDRYAKIIKAMPTPPIIMGHSFGGLLAQVLASRGYGCAVVGISPAQPSGVVALKLTTIKESLSILGNPFTYNKAVPITEKEFHYAFGNHLDATASRVLWGKYSVPAAGRVLWQAALSLLGGLEEAMVL